MWEGRAGGRRLAREGAASCGQGRVANEVHTLLTAWLATVGGIVTGEAREGGAR